MNDLPCKNSRRIFAFMIDQFIFTFALGVIALPLSQILNISFFVTSIVSFFLFSLKDIFGGKSIGKLLLGISVRDIDNPELTPPIWKLILRNITLIIAPIELIALLSSEFGQRLGDKLSGTYVIRNIRRSELPDASVKKKLSAKKIILIIVSVILLFSLSIYSFISALMKIAKESEPYKVTAEYILTSSDVKNLIGDVDEDSIKIHSFNISTSGSLSIKDARAGNASFILFIKGTKGNIRLLFDLYKTPEQGWQINRISRLE